jgi:glycerol-3-phosphate O-acyltransferase/dihydroxyacetone phosphate acyltransferase
MRRAWETIVRWLAQALVRLYYPHRIVEGAERISLDRPVVVVANHPNGLLDPLLVRVMTGRPARFLAKSTLFANPAGRLAMDAFGSIPVYRAQESQGRESQGRAKDTSRNEESFRRCRAALARGEALALFPEGVSHSDPQLRPLKTGAARIALSAGEDAAGLEILPLGLYYERKVLFRSRVLLIVGEPLAVAPLPPAYQRDERAAVDALTDDIRARLDDVVLQAESRELLIGISRVAGWTDATATSGSEEEDLTARHRRARELLAAYGRIRARDPARVEAIAAAARGYARTLQRLGVSDPWALEVEVVRIGPAARTLTKLILSAPLALVGALMGFIPYRLAGQVAKRVTRDEDVLGTVKMIAGAVFLFAAWAAEATAAAIHWGAIWALPAFALGVGSGYAALRFGELVSETVEALRHLALRAFHRDTARRLAARRQALADAVASALSEAG